MKISLALKIIRKLPYATAIMRAAYGKGLYKLFNMRKPIIAERTDCQPVIFADVSSLIKYDHQTGIQRVAKNLYRELAKKYRVTPVYADINRKGYFLAKRDYSASPDMFKPTDQPLKIRPGDIFLGLDFAPQIVLAQLSTFKAIADMASIFFIVHDLIPINRPECFEAGTAAIHASWLKETAAFARHICVSRSTAEELAQWFKQCKIIPRQIAWFHNGVDLREFSGQEYPELLPPKPYFLLVGTIEPRKGHKQTLQAFEILWKKGVKAALVFVGRQGWKMDAFCAQLRSHDMLNKNLFWYNDCSDNQLGMLYANADCALVPSEAEGFGLALIEAASFGAPLILRDLPVFREIAGDNAFYFSGLHGNELAEALMTWLELNKRGQPPSSEAIKWHTWEQSAASLMNAIQTVSIIKPRWSD